MAYVPWQKFDKSFSLCHALKVGTIFPCLEKTFCGKGGRCR
ncbi:MAG: spore coat associated protein CotJA [Hominisplanchenecus sp.]|uniref:Spore coat associated protein CotJA n=1 Tax=Faecalicatena fissicatena TaxID=290055 RepID=A0ABX2GVH3_9FIRM|nr:spore coat associated protein CotJA [Faecalicatena fissicatena]MBD8939667.1 spore coat associated protein CotJA [Lachnospiraceae bacterium]MCM0703331.1 spore coat associated protein CotJA [Faecalicatena sp. BF-R-105]MCB5867080.1 spore coat associated protein CotJA [Faecalicatena fissicatena]MEE0297039.1 spore coat associated protein CotJA [Lachnospiraceae bacterium]NSD76167.1 spore coat associated protein CotJA [Faecalicatena fissicatena]